jgi:inorganic triphosphatase YgiF
VPAGRLAFDGTRAVLDRFCRDNARKPWAASMATPNELELKLEVPAASLPDLGNLPILRTRTAETQTVVSVYYDTPKQKLRKNGFLLRVRRIGDRHVQTIKGVAGSQLFERDEWEDEIAGETPNLRLARDTALEPLVSRRLWQRLKPIFETRVRRRTFSVRDGDRAIEVALDKGRIGTGERARPLCELELELKGGTKAALFDLAHEVVDGLPARLSLRSKAERGFALLDGTETTSLKAAPVELRPEMRAGDGLRAIGRSCLRQVADNVPALEAGDPEGVHQMRVGLRRLRAAMSLFSDLLSDAQSAALKLEVEWLTKELGPARELEVLVQRVMVLVKRQHTHLSGLSDMARALVRQRGDALDQARAAVDSPRFRRLLLDIAGWIEIGQWASPQDDLRRECIETPIATFAAAALQRSWRKLRKKGKALRELDPRSRHKLRVQGKKLRYASEFFATLFQRRKPARRQKRFLSKLRSLQVSLGDLNDIVVHEDLIRANAHLDRPAGSRRTDPASAFAAGFLTGHEDARLEAAIDDAAEACVALIRTKPFW